MRAFCDRVSAQFRTLFAELDIAHDDFIRTTEPRHAATVDFSNAEADSDLDEDEEAPWVAAVGVCMAWSEAELEEGINTVVLAVLDAAAAAASRARSAARSARIRSAAARTASGISSSFGPSTADTDDEDEEED